MNGMPRRWVSSCRYAACRSAESRLLDDARTRDQGEWPPRSDTDAADANLGGHGLAESATMRMRGSSLTDERCCKAARMKPLKSGWHSVGRDLNSGWN